MIDTTNSTPFDAACEDIEVGALEHQLARLDLGEVEHLLDQPHHHARGAAQRLQHVGLLARQLRVAQQVGHADDGVERRAQLVAHHRDEAALGLVRGLGARERIEHARHQRAHVEAQNQGADHELDADRQVRLPERARREHHREAREAGHQREMQVGAAEAEAVGERDPDVGEVQRPAVVAQVPHDPARGRLVEHDAEAAARGRDAVGGEVRPEDHRRERVVAEEHQVVRLERLQVGGPEFARHDERPQQQAEHHAHDRLLVLGVGPRREARARRGGEAAQPGDHLGTPSPAGSCKSRCTSSTRSLTPRKASTSRGSKCLPRCAFR
jgi:hypothetical protein